MEEKAQSAASGTRLLRRHCLTAGGDAQNEVMVVADPVQSLGTPSHPVRRTSGASRPRVALALGSGGARGYAHIGVINELHERGYDIVGISGSSMGALVGGLQAAGKLDDFADWAKSLTQRAILRLLDPSITAAGVLRAVKILDAVRDILGSVTIEELQIPYTAVATDLITGKSVWLQRGPVDEAVRASIAIPGVITPYVLDGRLLADGGILDPLPMAPIAAVNADLTIAVSLSGSEPDAVAGHDAESHPATDWLNRVVRSTSAWFDANSARSLLDRPTARAVLSRFGASLPETDDENNEAEELVDMAEEPPETPRLGSFEVMNRTIDIAQAALARHMLAAYPPDLLIEVPRSACRSLEFHRADEVIEIGRGLASQALDTLASGSAKPAPPAIES
jgi:NTE family protein